MASGTPVIAPARGSMPEIIGKTGVLISVGDLALSDQDPEVTSDQETYIDRVVESIPKAKGLSKYAARLRVENLFSIKASTDNYEEAFAKAIYFKKAGI